MVTEDSKGSGLEFEGFGKGDGKFWIVLDKMECVHELEFFL